MELVVRINPSPHTHQLHICPLCACALIPCLLSPHTQTQAIALAAPFWGLDSRCVAGGLRGRPSVLVS